MLKDATSTLNASDVTDISNVDISWMMLIILIAPLLFPYIPTPRFLVCQGKQTRQHKSDPAEDRCADNEVLQELRLHSFATRLPPGHGAAVKTRPLGKHHVKPEWKCQHNPKVIAANLSHRHDSGSFLALLLVFPKIACKIKRASD